MSYVCNLSPELQKRALNELHEDPKRRDQDIQHIRDWINKQPHLNIPTDDWTILRFLRGCKFSLERTKEKIDMHYSIKALLPEWFEGRDPKDPAMRKVMEQGLLLPLKETDDKGRRVYINRNGAYDPNELLVDDITKAMFMILDVALEEDEVLSVTGVANILDMEGVTTSHMLHYPPTKIKKMMTLWQDGYALRTKGLFYVNMSSSLETIFTLFKSFMKEKLKKRIKVHGENFEKLYEDVPKRILPKEYGGENESIEDITNYWVELLDARRDWILENNKYGVDESKRPGKPKTSTDIFGIEGSFRKLNVD